MNKILLNLQYWGGDRDAAMRVARFIADLEPSHSEAADILFSARFDCTHDEAAIKYVSRKFNVHTFINKHRRAEGWPFSCNELAIGSVDYVYTMNEANKLPRYKAILLLEGDSCPLTSDWIDTLHAEWDRLHEKGANMIGAMIPPGPPETGGKHINGGSCVMSGDPEYLHWFARKIGGCRPTAGWDWLLAPLFQNKGWAACPGMRSYWRAPSMPREFFDRIRKEGAFFVHGVKDDSIQTHVRAVLQNPG